MRRPMAAALATISALAALSVVSALAAGHGPTRGFMDTRTPPCQDFFRYCNGAWWDSVSIPAAYTGVGAGRDVKARHDHLQAARIEQDTFQLAGVREDEVEQLLSRLGR